MNQAPAIFLAFANDRDRHLEQLKMESREIKRAFSELHRKEFIELIREESAQTQDIYEAVLHHQQELVVFHYGGHADGTHLELEDTDGSRSGLADLLSHCPNLKLVFLNGCSTRGQVRTLLAAGIPAVIATSVPIGDRKATEFSIAFYEALANRCSIQQAYDLAAGRLTLSYGEGQWSANSRDRWEEGATEEVLPWDLYLKEGKESATQYRLPYYREIKLPKAVFVSIQKSFPANRYILSVLEAMCQSNPDIYPQMVEQRGEEVLTKDPKDFPVLIIQNFPWPIGSQIRLLHLHSQANQQRLQTLLSTYVLSSQLLYYILLSDIWEQTHHHSLNSKAALRPILTKSEYQQTDFLLRFRELFQATMGAPRFVPELEQLYEGLIDEKHPLTRAHQFLETQRKEAIQGNWSDNLEKACLETEKSVALLLKHLAFLARFRMMTVRNVTLENPRFAQMAYELDMGPLNASESVHLRLYQDEARRRKQQFANCRSIILVPDENAIHQSLNLSPFIMDANTFAQIKNSQNTEEVAEDVANIFFLGWEEGDRLIYLTVNHDLFTALANERNTDQIHTDLRQDDFSQGRNLDEEDELDLGFDFGFEEEEEEESPRVFALLKDQYELLKAELGEGEF